MTARQQQRYPTALEMMTESGLVSTVNALGLAYLLLDNPASHRPDTPHYTFTQPYTSHQRLEEEPEQEKKKAGGLLAYNQPS